MLCGVRSVYVCINTYVCVYIYVSEMWYIPANIYAKSIKHESTSHERIVGQRPLRGFGIKNLSAVCMKV